MAKRPPRNQAADATATPPKARARPGTTREVGPAAVANREPDPLKLDDRGNVQPENISEALTGGRIEQAPGDAIQDRLPAGDADGASFTRPSETGEPDEREPNAEEIRRRAYEMYLERGGGHGADFDDWLRAEEELRGRKR